MTKITFRREIDLNARLSTYTEERAWRLETDVNVDGRRTVVLTKKEKGFFISVSRGLLGIGSICLFGIPLIRKDVRQWVFHGRRSRVLCYRFAAPERRSFFSTRFFRQRRRRQERRSPVDNASYIQRIGRNVLNFNGRGGFARANEQGDRSHNNPIYVSTNQRARADNPSHHAPRQTRNERGVRNR